MVSLSKCTAEQVIALLGLQPHPEGGWYAETFRDPLKIADTENPDGRAASTAIYFLLTEGQISRWHKVDAVEIWHWHAGAALELSIAETGGVKPHHMRLGNELLSGERPQGVVPRHAWQRARSLGTWTLVGCTVAPGFDFAGFELAPPGWEPG